MLQFSRLLTLLSLTAFLTLTGCNGESAESGSNGNTEHAAGDGHDHDHDGDDHDHEGEDHDDHDHGDHDDHDHSDHDDHDHGDVHELGSVTIDGVQFEVSISGEIEPNAEAHIDIVQTAGPTPAAVRLWIGIESGAGSLKSKADGHDNHFHGHAEVPSQIPDGASLWIEVESASGERRSASMPLS